MKYSLYPLCVPGYQEEYAIVLAGLNEVFITLVHI